MYIITLRRLNRATYDVTTELDRLGFYDDHVQRTEVYLVPLGLAFGWHYYGSTGDIYIPAVSLSRLSEHWYGRYTPLRDILRHEYAHAVADTHRGLMRSRPFRLAFDGSHESSNGSEYDPERHVTPYAATCPGEDFAEVFMFWIKHQGKLPPRFDTEPIRKRWAFIERLRHAMSLGKRKW